MTPAQVKLLVIGVFALILLGGGAYAVYSYNGAITRALEAEKRVGELEKANKAWKDSYDKLDGQRKAAENLARQRGARLAEETAKREEAESKFRTLLRESQADRDWDSTPVPAATRSLRRANA